MAKNRKLTKEELLKLAETMTIREIAEVKQVSYTTVWKYLKKVGYESKVGRPKSFDI